MRNEEWLRFEESGEAPAGHAGKRQKLRDGTYAEVRTDSYVAYARLTMEDGGTALMLRLPAAGKESSWHAIYADMGPLRIAASQVTPTPVVASQLDDLWWEAQALLDG